MISAATSPRRKRRWILLVIELELLVQRGVARRERPGPLEEGLCRDREELRWIRGPVIIEDRAAPCRAIADERLEIGAEYARPGRVHTCPWQLGRAVGVAVLLIELVRELMEHDVVPVARVRRACEH